VSTLVVCGLALLIPAPASSPHGVFDAALAFACVTSGDTSGGREWAAGALESDPPDSDDNDDDDDGPDGPDHVTIDFNSTLRFLPSRVTATRFARRLVRAVFTAT